MCSSIIPRVDSEVALQVFDTNSCTARESWTNGERRDNVTTTMMIFVPTMFFLPFGFVTLYLYVSGAFTPSTPVLCAVRQRPE